MPWWTRNWRLACVQWRCQFLLEALGLSRRSTSARRWHAPPRVNCCNSFFQFCGKLRRISPPAWGICRVELKDSRSQELKDSRSQEVKKSRSQEVKSQESGVRSRNG